jgi:Protein of unknown function (DUF3421)
MNSRTLRIFFALLCVAALFALPASAIAYGKPPATTAWFIALCYPHNEPTITPGRDRGFYMNMLLSTGTGSAQDYWKSQSYGHVSLANSVVTNWTDTGLTLAQHQQQSRAQNISTCVSKALAASNLSATVFYNYIAVYNGQLDEGAASVSLQGQQPTAVIIDAYSPETGLLHEMGHGFGLGHSYNDQNAEYGDPYDIMSAMGVHAYNGSFCVPAGGWYGCDSGPGLNAWTRWQLGWLQPTQRKMWWPATSGTPLMSESVTLAARNEPPGGLPQILYVPASSTSMYTVEWIDSDNYDQGTAANTLTIHKISYGNQTTYLVTEPGGVQTANGNAFYDSAAGVHIQLTSIQGSPATATVRVSVDASSTVWANAATSGTPPVDSNKVSWQGIDKAVGDNPTPSNAIYAGYDATYGNLYSCRTWYYGVQLGKLVSGECSFPWGGAEHFQNGPFETLTSAPGGTTTWVAGANGSLPAEALAAGFDGTNTLYVCRAIVSGNWTPGKFIWGQCDVSWGHQEMFFKTYQVLTAQ